MVCLNEPVKKTGRESIMFLCERALRIPLSSEICVDILATSGEVLSSFETGRLVEGRKWFDFRGTGMTQRSTKQARMATIDKPQRIQGEISVVAAAVNEPTSSAT